MEKLSLMKARDQNQTTNKLAFQEVHQTTILEENETVRGSREGFPSSKLGHQVKDVIHT